MDLKNQHTRRKTRNPAKIVRNGGPWAAPLAMSSDLSLMESPPEGLEFEAGTISNFCLICGLIAFSKLDGQKK